MEFKYANFHILFMSGRDIVFDVRLEEELDLIKKRIWLEEELRLQTKKQRDAILNIYLKLCGEAI